MSSSGSAKEAKGSADAAGGDVAALSEGLAAASVSPAAAGKLPFDVTRGDNVQITRAFWLAGVPKDAAEAKATLARFAATFREQYLDKDGSAARLSAQGDTSGFVLDYHVLSQFLPAFVDEQVAEEHPAVKLAAAGKAKKPKVSLTAALLSQCMRFAISPLPPSVLQQLIVARKKIWELLLSHQQERIGEVFRELPTPTTDILAFLNFALTTNLRCNAWVYSTAPQVGMKKVKQPNGEFVEVDDSGDIVFPVHFAFRADGGKISPEWDSSEFDLAAETEEEIAKLASSPPWDKLGIPIGTKGDNDGCIVLRSQCFWCRTCVLDVNAQKLSRCAGCLVPVYCSKQCQATDWKAFHASECPSLQSPTSSLRPALLQALVHNRSATLARAPMLPDATGIRSYHVFYRIEPNDRMPRRKGAQGWDQYVLDLTGGVSRKGEFVNVPWYIEAVDRKYSEEVGADMVSREEVEKNPEKYGVSK
ncbi:hypothetical protein DFJ74DRAFT_704791 [Hyaloraphidium curvatum]|nr:hypothetical protein DFJ74DRAFT_704791 [Hyaloraphidium curvatum]